MFRWLEKPWREVLKAYPDIEQRRLVHETVRRVIAAMVQDVLGEAKRRIAEQRPKSVEDVRILPGPLVSFSAQMAEKNRVLQEFLAGGMYQHPQVVATMGKAQRVIRDLFDAYLNDPRQMPQEWREDPANNDRNQLARQVCDFIAGMTDRYALDQHKRLFDLDPVFR